MPFDPPDTISIADFILSDEYRPVPLSKSRNPFTCGLTGKTFTVQQVKERVDALARGLLKELGWEVNKGTEWDKVVGVFAPNTVSSGVALHSCACA